MVQLTEYWYSMIDINKCTWYSTTQGANKYTPSRSLVSLWLIEELGKCVKVALYAFQHSDINLTH